MDPGVGPAGGVKPRRRADKLRQRLLHHLLDRQPVRLHLPAGVVGPVVFDDQLYSSHRHLLVCRGAWHAAIWTYAVAPYRKLNYCRYFSIRISAIWTALVAAPLRILSATTQRLRPFSIDSSSRIRPTKVRSWPAASTAMG